MSKVQSMSYNHYSPLWPQQESFFRNLSLTPRVQVGMQCVATTLATLTGTDPDIFPDRINTQDPRSWSRALADWDMKLAYCPTDVRRLAHYMKELIDLDDLFTLSYYTSPYAEDIFSEPDKRGWITGSHIVILHRDVIFDSAYGTTIRASRHSCTQCYTKRIFRVVPSSYPYGI